MPKANCLEIVLHEDPEADGLKYCTITHAPSEMDSQRSAYDGLIVALALDFFGRGNRTLNVRFAAVAPRPNRIDFLADVYLLTQRTPRSRVDHTKIGRFSGSYACDLRTGYCHLSKDLIAQLVEYDQTNIPVGQLGRLWVFGRN